MYWCSNYKIALLSAWYTLVLSCGISLIDFQSELLKILTEAETRFLLNEYNVFCDKYLPSLACLSHLKILILDRVWAKLFSF